MPTPSSFQVNEAVVCGETLDAALRLLANQINVFEAAQLIDHGLCQLAPDGSLRDRFLSFISYFCQSEDIADGSVLRTMDGKEPSEAEIRKELLRYSAKVAEELKADAKDVIPIIAAIERAIAIPFCNFSIGTRVRVLGNASWGTGNAGTVQLMPAAAQDAKGRWQSLDPDCGPFFRDELRPDDSVWRYFWVKLDQPALDENGKGPFGEGEFRADQLERMISL